jgi:hypothetical protein
LAGQSPIDAAQDFSPQAIGIDAIGVASIIHANCCAGRVAPTWPANPQPAVCEATLAHVKPLETE